MYFDSRILLLDREREKYTVDEHDESCMKSYDDLASVQILPELTQFLRGTFKKTIGSQVFSTTA